MNRRIVDPRTLGKSETEEMRELMALYYDDVFPEAFYSDMADKTHCILLTDDKGSIRGFSTQKVMTLEAAGQTVHGVFSGDTIIHRDCWGSFDLHKAFAEVFVPMARTHEEFYWFLISKGYKTYKMLPVFFKTFYPNCRQETPEEARHIMDAFGQAMYPGEYDSLTGVVAYQGVKDRLKKGVADIDCRLLRDPDIAFFAAVNPGHEQGHDLVCLASLREENLRGTARRLFLSR